jgi:hypothetical protein
MSTDDGGTSSGSAAMAEESLEICERFTALNRTNVQWQKDVAISRSLVARLKKQLLS